MNEKDYERKYYSSLLSDNEKKFDELLKENDFSISIKSSLKPVVDVNDNIVGWVTRPDNSIVDHLLKENDLSVRKVVAPKLTESQENTLKEVPIGTMMPNYEDGSIHAKTDKGWVNLTEEIIDKEVIADVPRGTLSNSDEEIKADWQDFDISEVENSELLRTREKLTKLENSAIKAFAGFEISYQRFVVLLVCAKISKLVMEKGRSLAAAISEIVKFSIRNVSEHLHLLSENGYLEKADLKVQDKVIWGYNLTEKGEKILDLGLIIWRKINVTDH